MPTITIQDGRYKTNLIDTAALRTSLVDACVEYGVTDIVLEQVHSSPQMGVVSAFSFGQTFGRIEAICELYGPRLHRVSPAVWKRRMGLKGEKKNSVEAARAMFGVSPWFTRVSYDGLAEAALLAVYASRDLVEEVDPLS